MHLNYTWFYCVFKVNCTTSVDTDKSFGEEVYVIIHTNGSFIQNSRPKNVITCLLKTTNKHIFKPYYMPSTQDKRAHENIRFRQNHCPLYYVLETTDFPPKQKLKSTSYCISMLYVMDGSQTTALCICCAA